MQSSYVTLHPGVEATSKKAPQMAARLSSLEGKRVALLDNGKVNAGAIVAAVAERLKARGVTEVRAWKKQHASAGGDHHFPEMLGWKPDFVLNALGD